jgi:hypothetical protein
LAAGLLSTTKKILSQRSTIINHNQSKNCETWRPDNEEDEDYDRDHGLAEVEGEKSEDGDVDRTQRCAAIGLPMVDSFFDFSYATDLHMNMIMNMNTAFRHEIGILHDIFQTTSSTQHW